MRLLSYLSAGKQVERVLERLVDLEHQLGREPPEVPDELIPGHRGQGLTIHHAVRFEPGFTPFQSVLSHEDLAGKPLVGPRAGDRRDDDGSPSAVITIRLHHEGRPPLARGQYLIPHRAVAAGGEQLEPLVRFLRNIHHFASWHLDTSLTVRTAN